MKIKNIFCVFLSVLFLFSMMFINVSASETLKGDMNGDGVLSLYDAINILHIYQNSADYDEKADIDSDGRITFGDFQCVRKLVFADPSVAKYADICSPSFLESLDGSNTISDEVKNIFSLKSEIISKEKNFSNYIYTVSMGDYDNLTNAVFLITFDESYIDETNLIFPVKGDAIIDYMWVGSQLLLGVSYNTVPATDSDLIAFQYVIPNVSDYVEPVFEVLEVNDMLDQSVCIHSGGVATCVESKVCDKCGEYYGNLAEHTGGTATCSESAICTLCGESYGRTTPHINADMSSECDICGETFGSVGVGINTSIIVLNDIVYYTVYFDGVKKFGNVDFTIEDCGYSDADYYYVGEYADEDVDQIFGTISEIHCNLTPTADYEVDENNSVLFAAYFIIRDVETFDYDMIPSMINFSISDVVMTDGSSDCPINDPIVVDCTHEHIDSQLDYICDLCGELITDNNCSHKDDDYNCRCDYCNGPYFYYGDMNMDGNITASDARIAIRMAANLEETTIYAIYVGDLDGDGKIAAAEARKILRVAARIDQF